MRKTEAIVTDELEAKAVYSRVKEAVEAAERSLAAIHKGEEDAAEVDAKGRESGSEEEIEVRRRACRCAPERFLLHFSWRGVATLGRTA